MSYEHPKKQEFSARIEAFLPVKRHLIVTNEILDAVQRTPSRFQEALQLLEDLYVNRYPIRSYGKDNFENYEETVAKLSPSANGDDSDEIIVTKINALHRMSTETAIKYMANLSQDVLDKDLRQQVWNELNQDDNAEGLHKVERYLDYLKPVSNHPWLINKTEIDAYKEAFIQRLFVLAKDQDEKKKSAAYKIVYNKAHSHNMECLKFLLEYNTEESREDAKNILKAMPFYNWLLPSSSSSSKMDVTTAVFTHLKIPAAYDIYTDFAIKGKDFDAVRYFKQSVKEDEAKPYIERFISAQTAAFAEVENRQLADTLENYLDIASSFSKIDPQRAMRMIARQKVIANDYGTSEAKIISCLGECGSSHHEETLVIDLLIERGTYEAVATATNFVILNPDVLQPDVIESQKMRLVESWIKLNDQNSGKVDKSWTKHYLCAFAQVEGLANEQTTEKVIEYAANLKDKEASSTMIRNMVWGVRSGLRLGDKHSIDFAPRGDKAEFIMNALIKSPKQNDNVYRLMRDVANKFGGEAIQLAYNHFQQVGNSQSMAQLRYLKGDHDAIDQLKKMPRKLAITQLIKAFVQNAYGSMEALIELRQNSITSGVNDVADFDDAIFEGVSKLAGEDRALLKRLRNGEEDKLKSVFDKLAAAGIVDIVPKFNAAVKVVACENELASAKAGLESITVNYPERNVA